MPGGLEHNRQIPGSAPYFCQPAPSLPHKHRMGTGLSQPPPTHCRGSFAKKKKKKKPTTKVNRMCIFSLSSFPKGHCWAGQSCLSDVSKSADFASGLRLKICDYSESNWLDALRRKLVIQGENTPNFRINK